MKTWYIALISTVLSTAILLYFTISEGSTVHLEIVLGDIHLPPITKNEVLINRWLGANQLQNPISASSLSHYSCLQI